MRVESVWPGGEVELPEFRLAGDPVVMSAPLKPRSPGERPEGLRAVVLGLARRGKG